MENQNKIDPTEETKQYKLRCIEIINSMEYYREDDIEDVIKAAKKLYDFVNEREYTV